MIPLRKDFINRSGFKINFHPDIIAGGLFGDFISAKTFFK